MHELTFQRSLRSRPPTDPVYRPRLSGQPGVVTAFVALGSHDEHSVPEAALDHRTSSITGRTRIMLSPAKATIAAALVFTIGGAILVAQPSQQESRTPPGAATDANVLVLEDGTGDLQVLSANRAEARRALVTEEKTADPADADLVRVTVAVDGERLAVRFDTAEAVPEVPDPSDLPIAYLLLIDTDGDPDPEYQIWSEYADGWYSQLFDITDGETTVPGKATVVDGAVAVSIGLETLPVAPSEMGFVASTNVFDRGGHDPTDILDVTVSGDRVPDDEDDWRALGERAAA